MESTLSKNLKITLLTVGLNAAAIPASAVTDITFLILAGGLSVTRGTTIVIQ